MKFVVWLHSIVFEVTISQYIFQWSVYLTTLSDKYVRLWRRVLCSLSILFLIFCPSFPPISFYLYGNIEWFIFFLGFWSVICSLHINMYKTASTWNWYPFNVLYQFHLKKYVIRCQHETVTKETCRACIEIFDLRNDDALHKSERLKTLWEYWIWCDCAVAAVDVKMMMLVLLPSQTCRIRIFLYAYN